LVCQFSLLLKRKFDIDRDVCAVYLTGRKMAVNYFGGASSNDTSGFSGSIFWWRLQSCSEDGVTLKAENLSGLSPDRQLATGRHRVAAEEINGIRGLTGLSDAG
jgi:hypothetical protein